MNSYGSKRAKREQERHGPTIFMELIEEKSEEEDFPKEKVKTVAMTAAFILAGLMNTIVLSVIHEKVPTGPPLPDIVFSLFPYFEKGLQVCEFIMVTLFVLTLLLILFQRHRWIVFRRLVTIASLLYFMRCFTMLATQVPVADTNFICVEKLGEDGTLWNVTHRGIKQVFGLGLNVKEKAPSLCGDYIYSGHTIILTISALFINEYSPRKNYILHNLSWISCWIGALFLIVSRGHYTIDVIISYYLCTRVFWSYHTLANNPDLRRSNTNNYHRKEFWYPLFDYLECQIYATVPYQFESPFVLGKVQKLCNVKSTDSKVFTLCR